MIDERAGPRSSRGPGSKSCRFGDNGEMQRSEWESMTAPGDPPTRGTSPMTQPPFAFDSRDPAPPLGSAPRAPGGRAGWPRRACRGRAAGAQPPPVLHLADGGFAAGEIRDSTRPGVLRWQAASFVSPFEFAVKDVNAIQWPPPATLAQARRRLLLRAGRRRRALRLAGRPGRQQGRAGHPAAGPDPRAAVEPPSDLPMARRRRPDLPRAQRPGSAGTSRPARRTGARNRASR